MEPTTPALRRQLSTVLVLATLLVVMCHADDVLPGSNPVVRFLGGVFTDANVANFFCLSGYFLARRFGEGGWWRRAVSSRLKTLAVPYFAWCSLALCAYALLAAVGASRPPDGFWNPVRAFGLDADPPCVLFPFWYIKMLFLFVVASPPFLWALRRTAWTLPVLSAALVAMYLSPVRYGIMFDYRFNIEGLICFLTGARLAFSPRAAALFFGQSSRRRAMRASAALGAWVAAAAGLFLAPAPVAAFLHPAYVVLAVFLLHRVAADSTWRAPDALVKSAFIVYAVHYPLLYEAAAPIVRPLCDASPVAAYFLAAAVAYAGGVAVYAVVRRVSPRALALLTGGRG